MIKYLIFLNGEYSNIDKSLLKDRIIYCVDGGANISYNYGILPHCIIGDLDSIDEKVLDYYKQKNVKILKYSKDKDYTDFELALLNIYEVNDIDIHKRDFSTMNEFINNKHVDVFGALGKRIDMSLSNMNLLRLNENMVFHIDKHEIMYYKNKPFSILNSKNMNVSFIPIEDIQNLTLDGFLYELNNQNISKKMALVSNKITKNEAKIDFSSGEMYIIKGGK